MNKKKLRFTGEWPPIELWYKYPNWDYALGEEALPGQDSTTLKPADNQKSIGEYVAFTAGEVIQANGVTLPALIETMSQNAVGVTGFLDEHDGWMVREIGQPPRWKCIVEDWLDEKDRGPSVSFDDKDVFPIIVRLKLPWQSGEAPEEFRITTDGIKEKIGKPFAAPDAAPPRRRASRYA
jgi:hypothetical protein